MKATYKKHLLKFKRPGGTSRGVLQTKETWYILISDRDRMGIGECGMFPGLSADDRPDFEQKLKWACDNIFVEKEILLEELREFPAIQMGLETALRSFSSEDPFILFPSDFTKGEAAIPINGLVWMGSKEYMHEQIRDKIAQGFRCIKMKIGALDFDSEISLLRAIREKFSPTELQIRVDANGAFSPSEALEKLKILSDLDIHSIEQPIMAGQWQEMAYLCEKSPVPIALDEELIGIFDAEKKQKMVKTISPPYIILKPTLIGGFSGAESWIELAENYGIGWWATSALESNIGLNAIAQHTYIKMQDRPQGLGTGSLFTNNIPSPLEVEGENLVYRPHENWEIKRLF